MRLTTYYFLAALIIVLCLAFYLAGYCDAKAKYQCDQVGGTSSIYNGNVSTLRICK